MLWTLVILITLLLIYKKVILPYSYWPNLGVKCSKPVIFFGDLWNTSIKKESYGDMLVRQYNNFRSERFYGGYNMMTPCLYIKDPELIRQILIKDFKYFPERTCLSSSGPLWKRSLVRLRGEKWYQIRCKISPTFTSSKMKMIFDVTDECANRLVTYFIKNNLQLQEIEMYNISTRYANDVIATCLYGINCDSLSERDNQFYKHGQQLTKISSFYASTFKAIFSALSGIFKLLGVNSKSSESHEYFNNIISETIKMREENNIIRKDMLQLLMEVRNDSLENQFTLEDIEAQAITFFFGGVSSISRLIGFTVYEIAFNHDIQRRLQDEIDDVMKDFNGILTYEALQNLKYLDMVVSESMRLWPPAPTINRSCAGPYKLDTEPDEPCLNLKSGDEIYIPIFALHRDPEHFPDPEKYDPERFSQENKSKIKPYTYLPFGKGPRNCVAMRFALIEAKVVLVRLLSKFEFVTTEKTQVPLKLDKVIRHPIGEKRFWVGLKMRSNN